MQQNETIGLASAGVLILGLCGFAVHKVKKQTAIPEQSNEESYKGSIDDDEDFEVEFVANLCSNSRHNVYCSSTERSDHSSIENV